MVFKGPPPRLPLYHHFSGPHRRSPSRWGCPHNFWPVKSITPRRRRPGGLGASPYEKKATLCICLPTEGGRSPPSLQSNAVSSLWLVSTVDLTGCREFGDPCSDHVAAPVRRRENSQAPKQMA